MSYFFNFFSATKTKRSQERVSSIQIVRKYKRLIDLHEHMQRIRPPKEGTNIMAKARNSCSWCCKRTDVIQSGNTIQVRYFLTRMGKMEHSHVIHFQHVNPKSISLRDVKQWLSDVEGKEMPESYAWSYKRRYKAGFVWHDVVDDDVIAPISNDKYVLKGSAVSSFQTAHCSCKKQAAEGKEDNSVYEGSTGLKMGQQSTLSSPFSSRISHSHVPCNCALARSETDATEPALVSMNWRKMHVGQDKGENPTSRQRSRTGGGAAHTKQKESSRISRDKDSKCWRKDPEFADHKKVSSFLKPTAEPICSQCGNTFKPERLHAHMQSCKGLKALKKLGTCSNDNERSQKR